MIQVVYDKIVDFCGVTDIPCVIVGSKLDLTARWELVLCNTSETDLLTDKYLPKRERLLHGPTRLHG